MTISTSCGWSVGEEFIKSHIYSKISLCYYIYVDSAHYTGVLVINSPCLLKSLSRPRHTLDSLVVFCDRWDLDDTYITGIVESRMCWVNLRISCSRPISDFIYSLRYLTVVFQTCLGAIQFKGFWESTPDFNRLSYSKLNKFSYCLN